MTHTALTIMQVVHALSKAISPDTRIIWGSYYKAAIIGGAIRVGIGGFIVLIGIAFLIVGKSISSLTDAVGWYVFSVMFLLLGLGVSSSGIFNFYDPGYIAIHLMLKSFK